MTQQAAVIDGGFSGILGQRAKPVRGEDLYQERYFSSRSFDLLDPESGQRIQQDPPSPRAQESLTELIDKLQKIPKSSNLQTGRRFFRRRVVSELSENSKHIVGENGARRFEEFKQYRPGWDHGRGNPLSPRSITTLESFLRQLPELATLEPSLFLTHEGNLQLGWEDVQGNAIEIEFFPDKVEYYIESINEEGAVDLEALHQLIAKVSPTIP